MATIVDTECVTQYTRTKLSSVKVTDSKPGQADSKMAGDCSILGAKIFRF